MLYELNNRTGSWRLDRQYPVRVFTSGNTTAPAVREIRHCG